MRRCFFVPTNVLLGAGERPQLSLCWKLPGTQGHAGSTATKETTFDCPWSVLQSVKSVSLQSLLVSVACIGTFS